MHTIQKFRDLAEVQNFLNGGLLGIDVSRGVVGLVGTTLTFTTPAAAVTFVEGTSPDRKLLFGDIKQQIEAVNPAIRVYQIGGQIAFIHNANPVSVPIVLSAAVSDAKKLLGFDRAAAVTGRIINDSQSAVPPRFEWWNVSNDNSHAILIWEG